MRRRVFPMRRLPGARPSWVRRLLHSLVERQPQRLHCGHIERSYEAIRQLLESGHSLRVQLSAVRGMYDRD